jgi:AcrR family transcriptional regulator
VADGQEGSGAVAAQRVAPREAQRRRTRREIVAATQRLLQRGFAGPTVDDIAAEADVSRRTVYSYFPTIDQLVLDATAGLLASGDVDRALTEAESAGGSAEDRVAALVAALMGASAETLPLGRRIIRLTVDPPGGLDPTAGRGQRRVEWLERALAPLRPVLDDERFERLVSALSLVASWEAMVVLQDIRALDADAEREVMTWAAKALVSAALADEGPGSTAPPSAGPRRRRTGR